MLLRKKFEIDWSEACASFDGHMAGCKGAECSTPCCNLKSVREWGGPTRQFRTTAECAEFDAVFRNSLPDGVTMMKADIGSCGSNIRYLVNGCLSEDGACKLRDKKPIQCRVYPFRLGSHLPVDTKCPSSHAIAADERTTEGIKRLRGKLGFDDNETWYSNLVKHLKRETSR